MKNRLSQEEKVISHNKANKKYRAKESARIIEKKGRDLYSLSIEGICKKALYEARKRAKKYNREFDITFEHLILIYPATHVCPIRFVRMKPSINKTGAANAPTLDRIDNNKGYILDNVRFISRSANSKKGSR